MCGANRESKVRETALLGNNGLERSSRKGMQHMWTTLTMLTTSVHGMERELYLRSMAHDRVLKMMTDNIDVSVRLLPLLSLPVQLLLGTWIYVIGVPSPDGSRVLVVAATVVGVSLDETGLSLGKNVLRGPLQRNVVGRRSREEWPRRKRLDYSCHGRENGACSRSCSCNCSCGCEGCCGRKGMVRVMNEPLFVVGTNLPEEDAVLSGERVAKCTVVVAVAVIAVMGSCLVGDV